MQETFFAQVSCVYSRYIEILCNFALPLLIVTFCCLLCVRENVSSEIKTRESSVCFLMNVAPDLHFLSQLNKEHCVSRASSHGS